uniref:Uncharacterized protein n=1 Tax=Oryza meridionalis TaxID=40149 RepID=A0A0E0D7E5_9ORYZ
MAPARSIVQHTQARPRTTLTCCLGIDTEASLFQAVRKQPDLGLTFQSDLLPLARRQLEFKVQNPGSRDAGEEDEEREGDSQGGEESSSSSAAAAAAAIELQRPSMASD